MIITDSAFKNEIIIDRNEVLRYLGYTYPYDNVENMDFIEECIAETRDRLCPKACYETFDICTSNEGQLDLGFDIVKSEKLRKNLENCSEIILFCATIGVDVDRLIQKYSVISPAKAAVIQAAGAAAIEAWCDILCDRFSKNKYLKPRFSPGYGDLPLELQRKIFSVLDCSRKIGVTLSEQLLMIPTKSVSAIVGISNIPCKKQKGCTECENANCQFRRN